MMAPGIPRPTQPQTIPGTGRRYFIVHQRVLYEEMSNIVGGPERSRLVSLKRLIVRSLNKHHGNCRDCESIIIAITDQEYSVYTFPESSYIRPLLSRELQVIQI